MARIELSRIIRSISFNNLNLYKRAISLHLIKSLLSYY